ncbi:MAG: transposase [Pseudomonadota bacterium]
MSGQIRYSDEVKVDAVGQITEGGYWVKEVAERLVTALLGRVLHGNVRRAARSTTT